jgi:selenocysteine lyase/cysteine desulfurase
VGWDWAHDRIRELGRYAFDALGQVKGLHLYLPREEIAGLVHFSMDTIEPSDVTARLYEQDILIRHVPEPVLNRVATGFYNNEEDIDRLVAALDKMVA